MIHVAVVIPALGPEESLIPYVASLRAALNPSCIMKKGEREAPSSPPAAVTVTIGKEGICMRPRTWILRFLTCALCLTLSGLGLSACTAGETGQAAPAPEAPNSFVPIRRTDYIQAKAEQAGISYEDAEALVDAGIEAAMAALAGEDAGEPTQPTAASVSYGQVSDVYTVQAVVVVSSGGLRWADCNGAGTASVLGDGPFTFEGSCTAQVVSSTDLRMALSGYFDLARDLAQETGITVDLLSFSVTPRSTYHIRESVYTTHLETLSEAAFPA